MSELVVVNKLEVPVFQNEYLAESVKKIVECSRNIVVNNFQIAYELASIKKLELYKEDGYESVTEFAEKVFGFSKTSTSLAIKVAERYLIDEGDRIATTFLDITGTDFSFNQLRETLSLSERKVNLLVFNKKLKPTMTVEQIRTLVQKEKNKGNNQSFDIETQENRGISSLEHELKIDISASSISSVQSEQELKEEKSDNISEDRESISSSQEEHELKQAAQNALESFLDSSVVSDYQNTSGKPVEGSRIAENSSSEHELKQNSLSDSSISSLQESMSLNMKDIPKELREYILMLEEENKRLKEENFKLLHPAKRKRGRPRKER